MTAGESGEIQASSPERVRDLYDASADSYDTMMAEEIRLPLYSESLGRLADRIGNLDGPLVDTSCGSGHMLEMYRQRFEPDRPMIAVDLSPRMVAITTARLGSDARAWAGDMRELAEIDSDSAAAVLSFFALHHLDPDGVATALREWSRVLRPGGQLWIATWEGSGSIDYGAHSDIVALRYTRGEIEVAVEAVGFVIDDCRVAPVEEMSMDAIYLEAIRSGPA